MTTTKVATAILIARLKKMVRTKVMVASPPLKPRRLRDPPRLGDLGDRVYKAPRIFKNGTQDHGASKS